MTNLKKTYFLASTWDYHPDGPIQLGNIVISPDKVVEPLNTLHDRSGAGARQPPESTFPPTTKYDVTFTKEKLRAGNYGVWTEFLSVLGLKADIGNSHESSIEETYAFDRLETTEFIPTLEYLQANITLPAVMSYIEKSRFRKHLYMVTAIKVAHGARAKTARTKGFSASLDVGLDATLTGAPVSLGPRVGVTREDKDGNQWEGSSDFVFAYRLRRIKFHRKGNISHEDYTKGAMYDSAKSAQDGFISIEVEGIADEDSCTREFAGARAIEIDAFMD